MTGSFDVLLSSEEIVVTEPPLVDTDGDGLTDREELVLCTDKNTSDTDGDGLSDGLEMGSLDGVVISDPCSIDSDHDGIPDYDEYQIGSNLLVGDVYLDADGDGTSNWKEYAQTQHDDDLAAGVEVINGEHYLDLTNSDAYVVTEYTPQATGSMTITSWVKFASIVGEDQLMGSYGGSSRSYYIGLSDEGKIKAGVGDSDIWFTDAPFDAEEWAHLTLVKGENGNYDTFAVFVNGERINYIGGYFQHTNEQNVLIGALNHIDGITGEMNAVIKNVQLWSKELNAEDIKSLMFNEPDLADPSLIAHFNFNRYRGNWLENVVTGEFEAYLTDASVIQPSIPWPDTDSDGITDIEESYLCTDGLVSDTDGDGLNDGLELGVSTGTAIGDPCSLDSDHDGMPDKWEYAHGSDLLVGDANSDDNNDGIINWLNYSQDMAQLDSQDNVPTISGDHELDLRSNSAYMFTSFVPKQTGSMTFMSWVRFGSLTGKVQKMGTYGGGAQAFMVGLDEEGDYWAHYGGSAGGNLDAPFNSDEWVHLALAKKENGNYDIYSLYINGERYIYTGGFYKDLNTLNMIIGAVNHQDGVQYHMDAVIDDVQFWSRDLTQEEVNTLMFNPPNMSDSQLVAYYDFSQYRGQWVKNVATGEFDAFVTDTSTILNAPPRFESDTDGMVFPIQ